MQFMVPRVAVPHPKDIVLVRLQTRKGYLLKLVH